MKVATRVGLVIGVMAVVALLWRPLHAQRDACSVPTNFGALKDASVPFFVFEAADRTIRIVNIQSCAVMYTVGRE